MKNKNALTILLYVFAVLSLAYTCYAAIQAYNTFTSYYSTNLSVVNLILYMITTCYESICFSVLFYALGVFSEMFKKKEEEKKAETIQADSIENLIAAIKAKLHPEETADTTDTEESTTEQNTTTEE